MTHLINKKSHPDFHRHYRAFGRQLDLDGRRTVAAMEGRRGKGEAMAIPTIFAVFPNCRIPATKQSRLRMSANEIMYVI